MYRWLALMDDHGSELTYADYYARKRIPWPITLEHDWILVEFGMLGIKDEVMIAGCWICESETSRMRDGLWLQHAKVISPRERLIWHLRSPEADELIAC
jgi:hypothetical protein